MGLLNFIKDVGDKFSGKLDGKAIEEKVKKELGSQIIDIKAEINGHELILTGLCENNDAREKAVLIAGNNKGIGAVNYFDFRVKQTEPEKGQAEAPIPPKTPPVQKTETASARTAAKTVSTQTAPEGDGVSDTEFYTIAAGDTLSKIAKQFYGNASKYPIIFEANREVIKDPDKIYVGQTIRIPKQA